MVTTRTLLTVGAMAVAALATVWYLMFRAPKRMASAYTTIPAENRPDSQTDEDPEGIHRIDVPDDPDPRSYEERSGEIRGPRQGDEEGHSTIDDDGDDE